MKTCYVQVRNNGGFVHYEVSLYVFPTDQNPDIKRIGFDLGFDSYTPYTVEDLNKLSYSTVTGELIECLKEMQVECVYLIGHGVDCCLHPTVVDLVKNGIRLMPAGNSFACTTECRFIDKNKRCVLNRLAETYCQS